MKTLLAWLIANIEAFTTVLLLVIFEVYIFTANIATISSDDMGMLAVGGALGIVAAKTLMGGVPTKNTIGDVVNLCIVIVAYAIIWLITSDDDMYDNFYPPLITILCMSLVIAVIVAIFTFRNFNEVVSRRILFINSNVSLFEIAGMYTFNRFVATFSSVSVFCLILALVKMVLK